MARIAFVVGHGYEDQEFHVPYRKFREAGHEVVVIGVRAGESLSGRNGGESCAVDRSPLEVEAADFDAVVIPGAERPRGLPLFDHLALFVKRMALAGKPVAAIGEGGGLLVEADLVGWRRVTSAPSLRREIEDAGGIWEDGELVEDGFLITARGPSGIGRFCQAFLGRLAPTAALGV